MELKVGSVVRDEERQAVGKVLNIIHFPRLYCPVNHGLEDPVCMREKYDTHCRYARSDETRAFVRWVSNLNGSVTISSGCANVKIFNDDGDVLTFKEETDD